MVPILQVTYSALGSEAATIKPQLMAAFERTVDSGRYILGPEVEEFEREFAAHCGTPYSVGLSDGTAALHLVMRSLRLKEGDEIITVANSFIATVSSIVLAGGRPVFADIGADGNIDPEMIEASITKRTRAILPVHLTGRPARMSDIMDIASRHNLFVIEDAAQAVGASVDGKRVGSWGDAACFSLHPLKTLHAFGDGGMMTTRHPDLFRHMQIARNHGLINREECEFWSFNNRLDELQAALLRIHLCHLDSWTEKRRRLAFRYNEMLKPYVEVPEENPGEYCVYQTYVIKTERRDALQQFLRANGVEALIHYATPIHLQPAAKALGYGPKDLPQTMDYAGRILSLPLYPGLSDEQQNLVVDLIVQFHTS